MSDIVYNNFCWDKQCPQYIEWQVDVCDGYGDEMVYNAISCQLVGQSYEITEYPPDCVFYNDIKKFEKNWEQEQLWERLHDTT